MADEQVQQEGQGGGKGKIIIIAVVAVVLLAGGGAAAFMMMSGGSKNPAAVPPAAAPAAQVPGAAAGQAGAAAGQAGAVAGQAGIPGGPPTGPLVPFDTVIVNLNEPGGTRYLKATFYMEVSSKAVEKEIEKVKIPIKDTLIEYLSSLTLSETQTIDAKRKIKVAIINMVNRFLTKGRIRNIYFTEFVVQ